MRTKIVQNRAKYLRTFEE